MIDDDLTKNIAILMDAGVAIRSESEWNALMEAARAHVKTVPAEFLE